MFGRCELIVFSFKIHMWQFYGYPICCPEICPAGCLWINSHPIVFLVSATLTFGIILTFYNNIVGILNKKNHPLQTSSFLTQYSGLWLILLKTTLNEKHLTLWVKKNRQNRTLLHALFDFLKWTEKGSCTFFKECLIEILNGDILGHFYCSLHIIHQA